MNTIKNIVKVDDNTIAVTRETAVVPEVPAQDLEPVLYTYDWLLSQKDAIQKQWDGQLSDKQTEIDKINSDRQAEMDEIDALIAGADKLAVTSKVNPPKLQ
jgi:hypothetical protein